MDKKTALMIIGLIDMYGSYFGPKDVNACWPETIREYTAYIKRELHEFIARVEESEEDYADYCKKLYE